MQTMEKEQHDSMATVQMNKADYAASEVYSTTSEAPPAYRRETSSVRIAKIIGLTVITASFILGAFILASTYLQARASCDQMQTLDSILEKELMLETLQQELPKAEALLSGRDMSDTDMQSLDDSKTNNKDAELITPKAKKGAAANSDSESDSASSSDNSFSESDEAEELNRVQIKMPLELSLSDLANAIIQQNQKSRMNCVIERRRAEEMVDASPKMTPFGFSFNAEPKKRVTGERMAIFCESGSAIKDDNDDDDDDEEPRQQIPIQRVPISFGPIPQQYPLTHMPVQQMPQQQQQMPQPQQMPSPPQIPPFVIRQIVAMQQQQQQQMQQQQMQQQLQQQQHQFQQPQQLPIMMRPAMMPAQSMMHQLPVPDQMMRAPRPDQPQSQHEFGQSQEQPQPMNGEIRIHLQRIPITQIREIPIELLQAQARPNMVREIPIRLQSVVQREPQPQQEQMNIPFREALGSFGLTSDDLMHIQRLAENRIQQELRSLAQEEGMGSDSNSSENDEDSDENSEENMMNMVRSAVAPQMPTQQQAQQATGMLEQPAIQQQSEQLEETKTDDTSKSAVSQQTSNDNDDDNDNDSAVETKEDNNNKNDAPMHPQILQGGRGYGRGILQPIEIPFDKMQMQKEEHQVEPRSIRDE